MSLKKSYILRLNTNWKIKVLKTQDHKCEKYLKRNLKFSLELIKWILRKNDWDLYKFDWFQ